jgi:hypothetical protein
MTFTDICVGDVSSPYTPHKNIFSPELHDLCGSSLERMGQLPPLAPPVATLMSPCTDRSDPINTQQGLNLIPKWIQHLLKISDENNNASK